MTQFLRRRQRGFTLLEIMVALMIFATAAVTLTKSLTESARSIGALEERQFGLIDILRDGYGNSNSGRESMAGFDFVWQRSVEQTPHPDIRRVDISVSLQTSTDVLATRSAFLNK